MAGGEWSLAEGPTIECLEEMGYRFIPASEHASLRDGDNHVLFRPLFIQALCKINGISKADAQAVYGEFVSLSDNEEWLSVLRGNYSRTVQGQATKQTIRIIDFTTPANNIFTVTNQFYVKAEKSGIPDIVIHVNGIPLVVIECKSPLNPKDKSGEAFDQIKRYERDLPRLFAANAFNLVTDGTNCLYGTTGSPSKFWGTWRDPWPKEPEDFTDALSRGLWSLLDPSRLLDLIAHFIVFEKSENGRIKKICRYQQFRAVNKIINRVIENEHRQGLIWHTQGSGKSLTMVYAALKLKTHLTVSSPHLTNPNIMVLTDRVDLDNQISKTFQACGLRNPETVNSIADLHALIRGDSDGLTALSTIFKFQGSKTPVANSSNWIVMVDECHRTQEKDLGAFLRATLPEACFFGFTGTPVKKDDRDTYSNFGVPGESYLDRYDIDDAVTDGATVPIYYTGRKTDWHIDEARIDILFDQWFADLPEDKLAALKEKGVALADLVKHPKRVDLIAYDIWTHFKAYAKPDGFKAQVVAIDREAVILYKRALDKVVAADLMAEGMPEDQARQLAFAVSACVFSSSQEDSKPHEDPYIDAIRRDLSRYYVDEDTEKDVKAAFSKRGQYPDFLIVCDKLLTGFDAPIEAVMYLDKPLKEHTLLQAIARTNRVADEQKKNGLIVDYIGVSGSLDAALSTYRADDIKNAMRNLDDLRSQLRSAHAAVMQMTKGVKRNTAKLKAEYDSLVAVLKTEDQWFEFRRRARDFINVYEALSPDGSVLDFTADLKWVASFLQYGTQVFEKKEAFDQRAYGRKIRDMLAQHLEATGLSMTVKLRHLTDPDFWDDFETEGKAEEDLQTAAIRKTTELRKVTYERLAENHHRYAKFSERLRALLRKLDDAQVSWAEKLKMAEALAEDLDAEEKAHEGTALSPTAYGLLKILEAFQPVGIGDLEPLATDIALLYQDDQTAPPLWQEKDGLRKTLRQQVREKAHAHGFSDLKTLSEEIEEFALKYFAKA